MAVAHKGAISFGLVHIPVNLYTATQDNDISFNQLHKDDNARIQYKKTCAHCGKEITSSDIIKGFQYEKDRYVVVTEDDLEKIKTDKDRSIQILHFANLNQISPIYYEKTYHVLPDIGGEKALELFRRAMMDAQKIAIGKSVFGTKETLLAIIPREDGILIQTMLYEDDIKEIPKTYTKPDVSEAELTMAKQLIGAMDSPFDPSKYHDEYQQKLKDLISQKIAGQEVVVPQEDVTKIVNLMDALKASLEQQAAPKGRRKKQA
jgi:DNA end-binding protein Ku